MINATGSTGAVDRSQLMDVAELAEIHSSSEAAPALKPRPLLLPAEEAASLPGPVIAPDPTLVMLSGMLGARLSVDNPAWSGDPIPNMRALQKKLVEHSLTMDEAQRGPSLRAIRIVEQAVQWRLRWQHMMRSDAEGNFNQTEKQADEKEKTA